MNLRQLQNLKDINALKISLNSTLKDYAIKYKLQVHIPNDSITLNMLDFYLYDKYNTVETNICKSVIDVLKLNNKICNQNNCETCILNTTNKLFKMLKNDINKL